MAKKLHANIEALVALTNVLNCGLIGVNTVRMSSNREAESSGVVAETPQNHDLLVGRETQLMSPLAAWDEPVGKSGCLLLNSPKH